MKYLGIDYGKRKIGISISRLGELAEPLTTIISSSDNEKLKKINNLCIENKIDAIVIGLPDGPIKKSVEEFAKKLEKVYGLGVKMVDETLTTKNALAISKNKGLSRKKTKAKEDEFAATLILQSYLDQNKNGS